MRTARGHDGKAAERVAHLVTAWVERYGRPEAPPPQMQLLFDFWPSPLTTPGALAAPSGIFVACR